MIRLATSSFWNNPLVYVVIMLAVFGAIVIGVILLKKYAKPFKNDEKPKSDKEIAAEELDRILEPVDDQKTKEEMEAYAKSQQHPEKPEDGSESDKPIVK